MEMELAAYQNETSVTLLSSTVAVLWLFRPHNQFFAQNMLYSGRILRGGVLLGLGGRRCSLFGPHLSHLGLGVGVVQSLLAQRHALSLGLRGRRELLLALGTQPPARASRRSRASLVRRRRKHGGWFDKEAGLEVLDRRDRAGRASRDGSC
jgi:hypothetical protein